MLGDDGYGNGDGSGTLGEKLPDGMKMPPDKALAVMTPPKITRIHYDAITLAVLEEQANDESPPRWLSDIESLVRYLVAHPERLAGEGQVVVKREEIENLRYLVSSLIGMEYDDATLSKIDYRIGRWLAGSPTAQESKDG